MPHPGPHAGAPRVLDPALDPFCAQALQILVARYGSPLLVIDAERVRAQYRRLAFLPKATVLAVDRGRIIAGEDGT